MDPVDLALIIAVDGSASVTFDEFNLMTGAMGAALQDPDVVAGLTNGPSRASLAALLLWSGTGAHEIMVDWVRIATPGQASVFAQSVANMPRIVRAGATAIGEALHVAERMLATAPVQAPRRVIDVVGDGRSNDGMPPCPVRDRLAASGVTINGLCVLHEEPDLLASYRAEVIGGPNAFALPCPTYGAFAEAMRRKLIQEIS